MVRKSRHVRTRKFIIDVIIHTPIIKLAMLLIVLWMLFSLGVYLGERGVQGSSITSYGRALYWGVAAFSTAGIAPVPVSGVAAFIGAIWFVIGSTLFFGAIVATVTAYFMRPLTRPSRQIIDTVEVNLERLDDLSLDELELLKKTADSLIEHTEKIKMKRDYLQRHPGN